MKNLIKELTNKVNKINAINDKIENFRADMLPRDKFIFGLEEEELTITIENPYKDSKFSLSIVKEEENKERFNKAFNKLLEDLTEEELSEQLWEIIYVFYTFNNNYELVERY